jgi:hypothetical protein
LSIHVFAFSSVSMSAWLSEATAFGAGGVMDYRETSDLFKRTCLLLDRILADMRVQEERWRLERGVGR